MTRIGNNIGDSGTSMISEALKSNTALTSLDLESDENEYGRNEGENSMNKGMRWYYEQWTILEQKEQAW